MYNVRNKSFLFYFIYLLLPILRLVLANIAAPHYLRIGCVYEFDTYDFIYKAVELSCDRYEYTVILLTSDIDSA